MTVILLIVCLTALFYLLMSTYKNYQKAQKRQTTSLPNQSSKETKGWIDNYFASKSMRQIVIEVNSPIWKASRFSQLFLPSDKYHTILQNPTSTGFVKMASEPTPILLMRANDFSDELKTATLDIAFSFFRKIL